ncbi:sigma-E factor negative regulatory protein [Flocculibacter collagenilyticus]|uniref:sigma-E factor negative regulatory protein n=1 Tax=Flocculibacter collagenilyticus TaxID=2744479 RepID=UPI0018F4E1E7|nr:RseA family anti-sigma factor [Flocculibacter collagenilyticus]
MVMKQHELTSVVMDNEATEQEISTFLDSHSPDNSHAANEFSEEKRATWARYHLASDVLRKEVASNIDLGLAERIEAALEFEAPHQPVATEVETSPSRVTQWVNKIKQKAGGASLSGLLSIPAFRYSSQLAIAATVAMVSVIGVQQYSDNGVDDTSPLPVFVTKPLDGFASPVSLSTTSNQQRNTISADQQRINALILDHQRQIRLKPVSTSVEDASSNQSQDDDSLRNGDNQVNN